ncbi:helix-turn-helix transcriptional regulator [Azospirillum sp. INR13]|uniref:helix-turn-helix domain-containing protein n=1 Tax=Azospirillum sp. INR13 TaxID=2596919 RepID=UPI001892703E|nr:helix-turn-helix transcriptional regulator [Azospirillum sp. INR13]MBF5094708.1 helix-turn-helix transcriptional regulator [Azospirillum sp. INR13]
MNSEADKDEIDIGLTARLRQCVEMVGSGDELSRRTGIPRRSLENYLSGKTTPKLKPIIAIAKTAGVQLEWLATGDGPMRPEGVKHCALPTDSNTEQPLPLLRPILEGTIEGLELALQRLGKQLTAKEKARVVSALYSIHHRRHMIRASGGTPTDVEREFDPDSMSSDVADLLNLISSSVRKSN